MKRRTFLKTSLTTSGALLLQFSLATRSQSAEKQTSQHFIVNGWLEITPENRFIFTLDKIEMGQNVITSLTAILAEEMDFDFQKLEVRLPSLSSNPSNPSYKPSWGTGGSSSVRSLWNPLRQAGAATKALFHAAAQSYWQNNSDTLLHENGIITNKNNGEKRSYAELAQLASGIQQPKYELKALTSNKLIGTRLPRYDAQEKVLGAATYGIDITLPNMKYAALIHPPMIGSRPLAILEDNTPANITTKLLSNAVAVIADSFWTALQAKELIKVKWQTVDAVSSEALLRELKEKTAGSGELARTKGSIKTSPGKGEKFIEAVYSVPFLAHAPLEPMNCTAWMRDGECEVWAPTQRPPLARKAASQASGLALDKIILHTTYLGGGFGRRLSQDYVTQAVEIAKQVDFPVKLIWTREDDMQQGFFRPAVASRLSATISKQGEILSWHQHGATPTQDIKEGPKNNALSLKERLIRAIKYAKNRYEGEPLVRSSVLEGALETPYRMDNILCEFSQLVSPIKTGAWRSVGHSYNAFFVESFVDELAALSKIDPIQFRLNNMRADAKRLKNTLESAVTLSQEIGPPATGHYRGLACHSCFGSHVALILEISIHDQKPKLEQVFCAADCGYVIDPDGLKAQLEGGILFGLSAALNGEITIDNGAVVQDNFHTYPILRNQETPTLHIAILDSLEAPGGAGEIGTPVAAPALINAWHAATGQRIRDLPLLSTQHS